MVGRLLEAPAAQPAFHTPVLIVVGLGRCSHEADAAIETVLDLPVFTIIWAGAAVPSPVDVVLDWRHHLDWRLDDKPPQLSSALGRSLSTVGSPSTGFY